MSFDEIFDLTAGVYFNFYNIYIYEKHLLTEVRKEPPENCNDLLPYSTHDLKDLDGDRMTFSSPSFLPSSGHKAPFQAVGFVLRRKRSSWAHSVPPFFATLITETCHGQATFSHTPSHIYATFFTHLYCIAHDLKRCGIDSP